MNKLGENNAHSILSFVHTLLVVVELEIPAPHVFIPKKISRLIYLNARPLKRSTKHHGAFFDLSESLGDVESHAIFGNNE